MRPDSTRGLTTNRRAHIRKLPISFLLIFLVVRGCPFPITAFGQTSATQDSSHNAAVAADLFRLEHVPIQGGAELVTVFAKLDALDSPEEQKWVPLVSVLRDTLGDLNTENDRLRYLWPLTYTRPTLKQRVFGAIPFLYTRVGNNEKVTEKPPPPAMDLGSPEHDAWNKIFWTALQNIFLDSYGTPLKASTRSYRRNVNDYRKAHIIRALSVLSLYESLKGDSAFSPSELAEIHSRLSLTDKAFGGLVDDLNLERYYEKTTAQVRDERAQNWELLRQRAEAESLYFEPLQMPDGSMTHALLWIAKEDLLRQPDHKFNARFLNISDPWSDKRLRDWHGYVETRYFDSDNCPVAPQTPGARSMEMIPVALYGLDNPKIPMLLIDFRDSLNPKRREMSRRILQDITRNLLSVSQFGNLPYFVGRTVFDFVVGRRGIDVGQPSRLRTYSQLKLLLALDNSLDPDFRDQIARRLEKVSLNPLENDIDVEAKLARQQYAALLAYAKRSDGLPARIERDRRTEMVPLVHSSSEQTLFRVANILTFGRYVHREDPSPAIEERLDIARRIERHTNFLRLVAKSDSQIDVVWDLEQVKRSLSFIADHGDEAGSAAITAAGRIFSRTHDEETKRACLDSLARIARPKAKKELLRISENKDLDPFWKDTIKSYISQAKEPAPAASSVSSKSAGRSSDQQ